MRRACIVRLNYYTKQRNMRRNAETLVAAGYDVDVICIRQKGERKRETINGVKLHRLPMEHHRETVVRRFFEYGLFFTQASLKLAQLSMRKRYDVIEVHSMPDFLVFCTLLPRLLGSKVILYLFENMPALFETSFSKSPSHYGTRLLKLIEVASARYAHEVVTSEGIPYKQELESRGIPSDKITVVLNVPDDRIFDPTKATANRNVDGFRLVVVSTVVKRYGVQTLVKALPLLVKDIPKIHVDVIGDGEFRPYLERLAEELGVQQHINFTGHIRYDDIPSHIAAADIGVAPMLDDVGVPNKLFEYFALSKASVASALPTLLATFDGKCVSYFRPGDEVDLAAKVLELYRDAERRAALASNGHDFYQSCQWPMMKQNYLGVYDRLLA